MYPTNILEEELKNRVAKDFFDIKELNATRILDKIDFCISYTNKALFYSLQFLWAEAKRGNKSDIIESFVQLILTIGKNGLNESDLPPMFLGAFDCEKIAFIEYHEILHIFAQNDFNWNVRPSDHSTKEFRQLYDTAKQLISDKSLLFYFEKNKAELEAFIKANFTLTNKNVTKIPITKNNFISVYIKWLERVKPTISVDWEAIKPNILDSDFYLADLLSENNTTKDIFDNLKILLQSDYYKVKLDNIGNSGLNRLFTEFGFRDKQKIHTQFWNIYERPPREEFWDYIIERRDMLVPQDIRERKGSFFTPRIWVEKAQAYLAKSLGENWQEEYYVWDCAAGTGNLLAGLTNKYHIFASTLDDADVAIMQERAKIWEEKRGGGINLLENHIFQFDFLNDNFFDTACKKHEKIGFQSRCKDCIPSRLPKALQEIIKTQSHKLVIFINPPYAETANKRVNQADRINKREVSFTKVRDIYAEHIGIATKQLYAQFLTRIKGEIDGCILAHFSKMGFVQGPNFDKFRSFFKAKFLRGFVVPSFTFDNVPGHFPIGFMIWNLNANTSIKKIKCDVFSQNDVFLQKRIFAPNNNKKGFITDWYRTYHTREISDKNIGALGIYGSDFQHNNFIRITNADTHPNRWTFVTKYNLVQTSIYLSVRHAIKATWLNDADQFLYPNKAWQKDIVFHNNCLIFALFHPQNKISAKEATNHFIPFSENEVGAKGLFSSHFMHDFINGKIANGMLFDDGICLIPSAPLTFSSEAQAVFDAGREVFSYYHKIASDSTSAQNLANKQESYDINASIYDIKAFFQGFSSKGAMHATQKATDSAYRDLIGNLNYALDTLAKSIESSIYEYGFLED